MPKQKESNFQTLPAMSGAVPCTASISASPLSPILPLEKEEKEKKPNQNQSINQSITKNNNSFFDAKQGAISVIMPVQLQTETCIVIYC
jgi:plastocyanin domain-containing protein